MPLPSLISATSPHLALPPHALAMKSLRKFRSYLHQRRTRRNLAQKASLQAASDQDDGRSKLAQVQHKIDDTESDLASTSTPAALSQELLLASWLITLLRTREDSEVSFEWAVHSREDEGKDESANAWRLSAGEVMPGLDTVVEQVAAAISRHIAAASPKPDPAPSSLLLSTGSLSRTAAGTTKQEVSAPCELG